MTTKCSATPITQTGEQTMNYCSTCGTKLNGSHPECPVATPSGRPVIVTTAHRGVFFGYADDTTGETITLRRARNCVYWSEDVKGFIGLAVNGPSASSRVGAAADITLRDITAVVEVSSAAAEKWESAPWK